MTFDEEQWTKESDAMIDRIKPILAGKHPALQGVVLAELLGIWLAGHSRLVQEELIIDHVSAAREFCRSYRELFGTDVIHRQEHGL